jgi:ParB family chromosome partitioning protein
LLPGTLLDGIASALIERGFSSLASALNLDMTRYWTPSRAAYFDHVSKARIAEGSRSRTDLSASDALNWV